MVERCLSKDPQQRPTSEQILDELGGAQPSAGWLPWPVAGATPGGGLPPEIAGLSAARGISMPTPTESAAPSRGGVPPGPATIDSGASAHAEQPAISGHANDREVRGGRWRRLDLHVQGRWTADAVPVSVTFAVPEPVSIAHDLADPDSDAFIAHNSADHGASPNGARLPVDGAGPSCEIGLCRRVGTP